MANLDLQVIDNESHLYRTQQNETREKLAALTAGYKRISHDMTMEAFQEEGLLAYLRSAMSPNNGLGLVQRARKISSAIQLAVYKTPYIGRKLVIQRPISVLLEENLDRIREWGKSLRNYTQDLERTSEKINQGLSQLNEKAIVAASVVGKLEILVMLQKEEIAKDETGYSAYEDKRSEEAIRLGAEIDKKKSQSLETIYEFRRYKDVLQRTTNLAETDRILIDAIRILYPELSSLYHQIEDWTNESESVIKGQALLTRGTELVTGTAISMDRLKHRFNQILAYNVTFTKTMAGRINDVISGDLTSPETLEYAKKSLEEARHQQQEFLPQSKQAPALNNVVEADFTIEEDKS